jgi:GNAT superfamily N-acetyltransferase
MVQVVDLGRKSLKFCISIDMIIRAKQEHFEQLFALIEQMVAESVFSFAPVSKVKIQQLFSYPKCATFLAFNDNKCIGFVSAAISPFFFSDYERATDAGLYVLPEHRGGKTAFKLLKAIENWAKEMGVKELCMGQSVGVNIENTKKFYEHNGYQIGGFNSMKRL